MWSFFGAAANSTISASNITIENINCTNGTFSDFSSIVNGSSMSNTTVQPLVVDKYPNSILSFLSFALSPFLFTFIGHILPISYSIFAIRTHDSDRLQKILMYWILLHGFLSFDIPVFLYPLFRVFSIPMFIKLVIAVVLSLSDFYVPNVVYRRILFPWYSKYRNEVNMIVSSFQNQLVSLVITKFKQVMWYAVAPQSVETPASNPSPVKPEPVRLNLGQTILLEARKILIDGIISEMSFFGPDGELLAKGFCKFVLNSSNELYIAIKPTEIQSGASVSTIDKNSSSSPSLSFGKLLLPLFDIITVNIDGLDDSSKLSVSLSHAMVGINKLDHRLYYVASFTMSLPSTEDCDGFIAGLQALSFASKKRVIVSKDKLNKIIPHLHVRNFFRDIWSTKISKK